MTRIEVGMREGVKQRDKVIHVSIGNVYAFKRSIQRANADMACVYWTMGIYRRTRDMAVHPKMNERS